MPGPIKEEPEAPPDLEQLLSEAKIEQLEAELQAWRAELDRLSVGAEDRAGFERQAQILRARLDALQQAGADATHEMLKRVDAARAELKKAFESAAKSE